MIKGYKKVWSDVDGRVDIEISISSGFRGDQNKIELTDGYFLTDQQLEEMWNEARTKVGHQTQEEWKYKSFADYAKTKEGADGK